MRIQTKQVHAGTVKVILDSINWITPKVKGIGNAAGYAHHNSKMLEHTSKLMDIADPFSKYALHIVPADQFRPIKGKVNILFTMWEMLDLPASYKLGLATADYVIVPCKFCKDLFQPYVKKRIYVVGEGIEPEDFPYFKRKQPDYANGERFRIYWAGAPNPRKGYQFALELIRYMQDIPQVELYIKTTMPKTNPDDLQQLAKKYLDNGGLMNVDKYKKVANGEMNKEYHDKYCKVDKINIYGKHKNILFDTRRVPFRELRELYNKANIFLFPSMGEGWGLMGCEAMATGCPTLAPRITGIAEYFNNKVGYVLKHGITTVDSKNYKLTARTYTPLFNDILEKIDYVIANYNEALQRGAKGSKHIHESFIWSKKAKLLQSILDKIDKQELSNGERICNTNRVSKKDKS